MKSRPVYIPVAIDTHIDTYFLVYPMITLQFCTFILFILQLLLCTASCCLVLVTCTLAQKKFNLKTNLSALSTNPLVAARLFASLLYLWLPKHLNCLGIKMSPLTHISTDSSSRFLLLKQMS